VSQTLSIGIDIGGTKVLGGVVDSSGNILSTSRKDTPKNGGRELTLTIAEVAKELLTQHKVDHVGISAAGFVSSDRKTMLATPNIMDWNGINLERELSGLIGTKVVIENDANAAAWGEFVYGAGKSANNMLMVTVGTGIGGGIVVDGNLLRGAFGTAAEIGHMRLVPEGHMCGCGALGCFEQYASGSGLMRHVRELITARADDARHLLARANGSVDQLKGAHITEAAQDGDSLAIEAFNITAHHLGAGLASLCVILDPEIIVIGGGVIDAGELLLAPTEASLKAHMPFAGKHPYPRIVAASLGNDAGLVGAADLALH
jgi:glucokinase